MGLSTEPGRGTADTSGADAMLIGGDNYHFLLDSSRGVGAQLEANGLTVHYTEDTSQLSAATLANKKVLVILKDGGWPPEDGSQWMTPEQEVAIEEWVLKGGGLMPLHNSLWAIPGWEPEIGGKCSTEKMEKILGENTRKHEIVPRFSLTYSTSFPPVRCCLGYILIGRLPFL